MARVFDIRVEIEAFVLPEFLAPLESTRGGTFYDDKVFEIFRTDGTEKEDGCFTL